jgi:hypothetical protein
MGRRPSPEARQTEMEGLRGTCGGGERAGYRLGLKSLRQVRG